MVIKGSLEESARKRLIGKNIASILQADPSVLEYTFWTSATGDEGAWNITIPQKAIEVYWAEYKGIYSPFPPLGRRVFFYVDISGKIIDVVIGKT